MSYTRLIESQPADVDTPISIYLKLRDHFERVVLLESNDFESAHNCHSYICCDALQSIRVHGGVISTAGVNGRTATEVPAHTMLSTLKAMTSNVVVTGEQAFALPVTGYFGYIGYDAVKYFEEIEVASADGSGIPNIALDFFRYVIAFDHFRQTIHIVEHRPAGHSSGIPHIKSLIYRADILNTPFRLQGRPESNMSDAEYLAHVKAGKDHCQRGDVFQVVLSRRFQQAFRG
ncbi:MAG: hypothetical protein R3330_15355, partial [Saprospiraceae bacterium]|nr:hypothetical protein [Saprospiraceae bacterium]